MTSSANRVAPPAELTPADSLQVATATVSADSIGGSQDIETPLFRMGGFAFIRYLMKCFAMPWLLSLTAISLIGIALGILLDIRILIIALMIITIIIPMLMAFMYYYHGLRQECFFNVLPHTIRISPQALTIRLHIKEPAPDPDPLEAPAEVAPTSDPRQVATATVSADSIGGSPDPDSHPGFRISEISFPRLHLAPAILKANALIIPINSPAYGFIWIPQDALSPAIFDAIQDNNITEASNAPF
ncbi:MAG: hypothetical protein ACI304_00460 [Lepagella sp.]